MKSLILVVLTTLLSTFALAGDGGFFLQTCISESGRTNLTIFQNNYSGAEVPLKVVFGIDGEFVTYAPKPEFCTTGNCLSAEMDPVLLVKQGSSPLLTVEFGDSHTASVEAGFFDPRPDYVGVEVGRINLVCKEYFQEP